jgi:hypothetical protein
MHIIIDGVIVYCAEISLLIYVGMYNMYITLILSG